jgi:hypothetical protein
MSILKENSGTLLKDSKFGMALNTRRYSVGLGRGDFAHKVHIAEVVVLADT